MEIENVMTFTYQQQVNETEIKHGKKHRPAQNEVTQPSNTVRAPARYRVSVL